MCEWGGSNRFVCVWLHEGSSAVQKLAWLLWQSSSDIQQIQENLNSLIVTIWAGEGVPVMPLSACLECIFIYWVWLSAFHVRHYMILRSEAAVAARRFALLHFWKKNKELEWMNQLSDSFLLYPFCQRRMFSSLSLSLVEREANLL